MSRFRTIVAVLGLLVFPGCGTPQFSNTGRDLMRPLQTAVSAKNLKWVDATEEKIKSQHKIGKLPDADFDALSQIVRKSREGDWEEAEQTLFSLMEGQRASADDRARLEAGLPKPPADDEQKPRGKRRP